VRLSYVFLINLLTYFIFDEHLTFSDLVTYLSKACCYHCLAAVVCHVFNHQRRGVPAVLRRQGGLGGAEYAAPPTISRAQPGVSLPRFTALTLDDVVSAVHRLPDKSSAADPLPHFATQTSSRHYSSIYQNLQIRFGIERHPYTESRIDQIPCVCMYVCVTTPKPLNRFVEKLYQQIGRLALIALNYLDLKYLPTIFKTPKNHFWGPRNVKPMGNTGLL